MTADDVGTLVAAAPRRVEWRLVRAGRRLVAACYLNNRRVRHSDGVWWDTDGFDRRDLTDCEVLLLWSTGPSGAVLAELAPLYGASPPVLAVPSLDRNRI